MLKVLSLFSGIGAFEIALDNCYINWKLEKYCEIEKEVSKAYDLIHGTSQKDNLIDITKLDINKIGEVDLITYGFPCQDISIAGKQKGFYENGLLSRSGLFYYAANVINVKRPKIAIFENVKALTSKKFEYELNSIMTTLDEIGYNTYYKVLNAYDYGIPQSRERVFGISIRKDIDHGFNFPNPTSKNLDMDLFDYMDFRKEDDLTFNFIKRYREVKGDISEEEFSNYLYGLETKANRIQTKKLGLYNFCEMDTVTLLSGCSGTLTCRNVQNYNKKYLYNGKLYKPSPRMCFRLMGFEDCLFNKISHFSDKTLYNIAGNTIVVNVIAAIFEELAKQYPEYFN